MLLLLFQAGEERYGIPAQSVVEVLPVPLFRPSPGAPEWVAGTFTYHGTVTPAVDLSAVLTGTPAKLRLSTRVALTRYRGEHLLGLLAEDMVETMSCKEGDFQPAGVRVDGTPYLGDLLPTPDGMIQRVDVERLLPEHVRERLFRNDG